jgi:hypothetical protein
MAYITRKDWFHKHMLPIFNARQPQMHITFDMFGNKSRDPKGFDHRTKSQHLREMSGELHAAEVEALNAYGTDEFAQKNDVVYRNYMKFISLEDAVAPHKTTWVRRYKKIDLETIQKHLPDFCEFSFKCWTSRPEEDENKEMLIYKHEFRKAYQHLLKTGDASRLLEWDRAQKEFYGVA